MSAASVKIEIQMISGDFRCDLDLGRLSIYEWDWDGRVCPKWTEILHP